MEKSVKTLIKKKESSRALLDAALEKIAPQTQIYPSWKMKQVLDHIAGWDQLVISSLRAYQNGDTPVNKFSGIDVFNATSVTARKELSLEQSRHEYDTARQEVLFVVRSKPFWRLKMQAVVEIKGKWLEMEELPVLILLAWYVRVQDYYAGW